MAQPAIPLPDHLTKGYGLGSDFFVFRQPFLINASLSSRAPGEQGPQIGNRFETKLANRVVSPNDVFVGIAGLKALDLLTLAGKSMGYGYQHAVLFDVNERQLQGMRKVIELIKACETPQEFIEKFAAVQEEYMQPPVPGKAGYDLFSKLRLEDKQNYHNVFGTGYQPQTVKQTKTYLYTVGGYLPVVGPDGTTHEVRHTGPDGKPIPREHSWLQKEHYDKVRALALDGKIEVATMDLRDTDRTHEFIQWLKKNEYHVGDCYVSSLVSFADPYMKYDYYSKNLSWGQIRNQTQSFFRSLIALSNNESQFIISEPTSEAPFFHTYHLDTVGRQYMQDHLSKLPAHEPSTEEKKYAALFNAGGQVWRLAGFMEKDPATGRDTTKYFRIFSEGFPKDRGRLDEQLDIINDILRELYRQQRRTKHMTFVAPDSTLQPPIEKRFDTEFFEYQKESQGANVVLSSNPFHIRYDPSTQDPAEALEALIKVVQHRLGRNVLREARKKIDQVSPPPSLGAPAEPLQVIVKPEAIEAALKRTKDGSATPPGTEAGRG